MTRAGIAVETGGSIKGRNDRFKKDNRLTTVAENEKPGSLG